MINSETEITAKIDWLSITVPKIEYDQSWSTERKEMRRGLMGYDVGVKYLDGRIELCSSTRKDMLPHVIFSGTCIDRLCLDSKGDTMSILRAMSNGKPSRLDIAIDVKKGTLPIREMRFQFDNDQAITKAKKGIYMETIGNRGETLYIGSVDSLRRIRIYDKAAEQGLKDQDWTRIELQLRNSAAAQSFLMLIASKTPYDIIPKLIVGFVDFPEILDWIIVMGSEGLTPTTSGKNKSNRLEWLMDTAAKSLANEAVESGQGEELINEFMFRALLIYAQKRSEYK